MVTPLNLLLGLPADRSAEVFETIASGKNVRIERIVSYGHASPKGFWYDQSEAEWILLLQGKAIILLEGDEAPIQLKAGDCLTLPAHRKHRVEWTEPDEATIWLALFFEE